MKNNKNINCLWNHFKCVCVYKVYVIDNPADQSLFAISIVLHEIAYNFQLFLLFFDEMRMQYNILYTRWNQWRIGKNWIINSNRHKTKKNFFSWSHSFLLLFLLTNVSMVVFRGTICMENSSPLSLYLFIFFNSA